MYRNFDNSLFTFFFIYTLSFSLVLTQTETLQSSAKREGTSSAMVNFRLRSRDVEIGVLRRFSRAAVSWDVQDYPDPRTRHAACGLSSPALYCDPDGYLKKGDSLESILTAACNGTPCACPWCGGTCTGYTIAVAVLQEIKGTARSVWADELSKRWRMGHCGDVVVVVATYGNKQITTSVGSAARDVITDTCTDKIIEDKKKDGVTFENLLQSVVSEYKSSLERGECSMDSKKTLLSVPFIVIIVHAIIVFFIILMGCAWCCVWCIRHNIRVAKIYSRITGKTVIPPNCRIHRIHPPGVPSAPKAASGDAQLAAQTGTSGESSSSNHDVYVSISDDRTTTTNLSSNKTDVNGQSSTDTRRVPPEGALEVTESRDVHSSNTSSAYHGRTSSSGLHSILSDKTADGLDGGLNGKENGHTNTRKKHAHVHFPSELDGRASQHESLKDSRLSPDRGLSPERKSSDQGSNSRSQPSQRSPIISKQNGRHQHKKPLKNAKLKEQTTMQHKTSRAQSKNDRSKPDRSQSSERSQHERSQHERSQHERSQHERSHERSGHARSQHDRNKSEHPKSSNQRQKSPQRGNSSTNNKRHNPHTAPHKQRS